MKKISIMAVICLFTSISADASVDIWRTYHDNGKVECEIPYVDGKIHGIKKCYYQSGELFYELPYFRGNEHGIAKYYYDSGELLAELPYVIGKMHGIAKYYSYVSGRLKIEKLCVNGEVKGTNNYDENGNIIKSN